jgi:hypothetical protein
MSNEKKKISGINIGDRVIVKRPGQKAMTGKVVRNDEMAFEVDRDDVPAHVVDGKKVPYKIHIFGTGSSDIVVKKI